MNNPVLYKDPSGNQAGIGHNGAPDEFPGTTDDDLDGLNDIQVFDPSNPFSNDPLGLGSGFFALAGEVAIATSKGLEEQQTKHAQDALAGFREDLDLPRAGSLNDKSTVAFIEIEDRQVFGINAHGQKVEGVNSISKTHAEIDALNQLSNLEIDLQGRGVTMYVDRDPCAACGRNGGMRSMVRSLGLESLTVVSPSGTMQVKP